VCWSSAGAIGFKGSRKGTPYAAQQASLSRRGRCARPVRDEERGSPRERAPAPERESAVRALAAAGPPHRGDPRRHADSPQRLPPAEAPPRLIFMAKRKDSESLGRENRSCKTPRCSLPPVPPGRAEAVFERPALLYGEVRD